MKWFRFHSSGDSTAVLPPQPEGQGNTAKPHPFNYLKQMRECALRAVLGSQVVAGGASPGTVSRAIGADPVLSSVADSTVPLVQ